MMEPIFIPNYFRTCKLSALRPGSSRASLTLLSHQEKQPEHVKRSMREKRRESRQEEALHDTHMQGSNEGERQVYLSWKKATTAREIGHVELAPAPLLLAAAKSRTGGILLCLQKYPDQCPSNPSTRPSDMGHLSDRTAVPTEGEGSLQQKGQKKTSACRETHFRKARPKTRFHPVVCVCVCV
ncbi:hypothetical protein EJ04DRAFT_41690 [Polyplosphaeria fusca]|uniref:Uncharacterized protein n=1 Tax=Polyplosphaeria fusca TaxID=682080 RepID=A0A9P4R8G6_9PLEO|nr:hypothetical protein EJ04DRAFT_41690 [Polyplosphaeria fusca]